MSTFGLADRSHLMSRMITLDTHIADVVNLFRWERLENVILCGHSYAGWVISGAVEQVHKQVKAIVYLDAHFPCDGECGVDLSNSKTDIVEADKRCESSTRPRTAEYFEPEALARLLIDARNAAHA